MAFLVTLVVKYILIPNNKKNKIEINLFFKPIALLAHNFNIIFISFELLFNNLIFQKFHFIFGILFGIFYIIFSWLLYQKIKIFYYFFMDYQHKNNIFYSFLLSLIVSLYYFFFIKNYYFFF